MKKSVRFLSLLLSLLLILGLQTPVCAQVEFGPGSRIGGTGNYDSNWIYWSQGASRYENMRYFGCYIVALSKLMVEAGVKASDQFTPDDCFVWACNNDYLDSGYRIKNPQKILSDYSGTAFDAPKSVSVKSNSYDTVNQKVLDLLEDGYYVILERKGNRHYVYVHREKSLEAGAVILSNSQSDIYNSKKGHGFSPKTDLANDRLCGPLANLKKGTFKNKAYTIWAFKPQGEPTPPDSTKPDGNKNTVNVTLPADGLYTLSPKCAPGASLDVNNGSKSNKANIQIYHTNGTASQQFTLKKVDGDYYTICAKVSGRMLDVSGGKKTSGTNVWQYTGNGTASQRWKLKDAGGGYWYIIPKLNTNLALDVSGGGSADSTNVQVYTKNGSDAQKWKLTPVSSDSETASSNNTPADAREARIIDQYNLWVHSAPNGSKSTQIGKIPAGSDCLVFPAKQSGNWYWVKYGDLEGYVIYDGVILK